MSKYMHWQEAKQLMIIACLHPPWANWEQDQHVAQGSPHKSRYLHCSMSSEPLLLTRRTSQKVSVNPRYKAFACCAHGSVR